MRSACPPPRGSRRIAAGKSKWDPRLLAAAEGLPLKNITLSAGGRIVPGEMLITRYGLEGGALYQLGRELRGMPVPRLQIDFKPDLSEAALLSRRPSSGQEICQRWRLGVDGTGVAGIPRAGFRARTPGRWRRG